MGHWSVQTASWQKYMRPHEAVVSIGMDPTTVTVALLDNSGAPLRL